MDIAHAEWVGTLLDALDADYVLTTSDDPQDENRIAEFKGARTPWLVCVAKAGEGVSITRLRVIVDASDVTAERTLRQLYGRLARKDEALPGDSLLQNCVVYTPADPRKLAVIAKLKESLKHVTKHRQHTGKVCPKCGHSNPRDAARCENCGHEFVKLKGGRRKWDTVWMLTDSSHEQNGGADIHGNVFTPQELAALEAERDALAARMSGDPQWAALVRSLHPISFKSFRERFTVRS